MPNKKNIGFKIKLTISVIVLSIFLWLIFKPKNKEFGHQGVSIQELGYCDEDKDLNNESEIRKITYDNNALVVEIQASAPCGEIKAKNPYAITKENEIIIGWSWVASKNSPLASCICTKSLELRVPNVLNKKAKVIIDSRMENK